MMENQVENHMQRETELLGGPWDLVTTYSWAYSLNSNPPKWLIGVAPISRVIIPVINSY